MPDEILRLILFKMQRLNISPYAIPGIIPDSNKSIDDAVCEVWGITNKDLKRRIRKRNIVEARQVAMWYRHKIAIFPESLTKSGRHYNKDHATVIHACRQVDILRESDPIFAKKVNQVIKLMQYD